MRRPTLPSANDLNFFLEVANTSNLSRASERLGITQPALSLSIKRLEDSLGVPLLIRAKTGVKLTKAGHKLAHEARFLLQEWERISSETQKDELEVRGHYTLGCHQSVALYSLYHFLPELVRNNPHLNLSLEHDLSRKITEDIISFKLDFAIVVNPVSHPDLIIKELCKDKVTLWIDHSLAQKDPAELALLYDPHLAQSQDILATLTKKKIKFRQQIKSGSLEVIKSLTDAGCGVGILPTRVAKYKNNDRLEMFIKNSPPFHVDRICLIYRADTQKSPASKLLAQTIFETLKRSL